MSKRGFVSYSDDFRKSAVDAVKAGESPRDVAERMKCSLASVQNWLKAAEGLPKKKAAPAVAAVKAAHVKPVKAAHAPKEPEALTLFEVVERVYRAMEPLRAEDRSKVFKSVHTLLGMLSEDETEQGKVRAL